MPRIICTLSLLLVCAPALKAATYSCHWLQHIPVTGVESEDLADRFIYTLDGNEAARVTDTVLRDSNSQSITAEEAARVTHGRYVEVSGRKPFILRAVYWGATQLRPNVSYLGTEVTVALSAGAPQGSCHKTAILANLDFVPSEVYFALWGGQ
jgi:hypothetical protein